MRYCPKNIKILIKNHQFFPLNFNFSLPVAFFLMFTLSAFNVFYMLTMRISAIFQLIESIHNVMLSSFGIFSLCYLTDSTKNAIGDCSQFLISLYSTEVDACENINQKVDVCILLTFLLIRMWKNFLAHFVQWIIIFHFFHATQTTTMMKIERIFFYCCAFHIFFLPLENWWRFFLSLFPHTLTWWLLVILYLDWNHSNKGYCTKWSIQLYLWIFWHRHEITSFICGNVHHISSDFDAI